MAHIPVLLSEALQYLAVKPNANYIDATLGGGGYTKKILDRSAPHGKVLAIDWSEDAIKKTKEEIEEFGFNNWTLDKRASKIPSRLQGANEGGSGGRSYEESEPRIVPDSRLAKRLTLAQGNFADIETIASTNKIEKVMGVVFDLGLSTDLLEESGRGFSYQRNEPLLMNFSKDTTENNLSALELINSYSQKDLERVFVEYGEIRQARAIAERIIKERKDSAIKTTFDLRDIIRATTKSATPKLLAQIWQAIRIEVNRELDNLEKALEGAWNLLGSKGRIVVVSFHSLEDRIVKNFFREKAKSGQAKLLNKKPIIATKNEQKINTKSRSAKLRALMKSEL